MYNLKYNLIILADSMKTNFIEIYAYEYPFEYENTPITQERIDSYKNGTDYEWRLLEMVVKDTLDVALNDLHPRMVNGKWVIDNYYISISESCDYVVSVVSDHEIGASIQLVKGTKVSWSSGSRNSCNSIVENALRANNEKNALRLLFDDGIKDEYYDYVVSYENNEGYFLSVASKNINKCMINIKCNKDEFILV